MQSFLLVHFFNLTNSNFSKYLTSDCKCFPKNLKNWENVFLCVHAIYASQDPEFELSSKIHLFILEKSILLLRCIIRKFHFSIFVLCRPKCFAILNWFWYLLQLKGVQKKKGQEEYLIMLFFNLCIYLFFLYQNAFDVWWDQ